MTDEEQKQFNEALGQCPEIVLKLLIKQFEEYNKRIIKLKEDRDYWKNQSWEILDLYKKSVGL